MLPERHSIITIRSDSVARPIIQDSHSCDWGSNPHRSTFLFYNQFYTEFSFTLNFLTQISFPQISNSFITLSSNSFKINFPYYLPNL